MWKVWANALGAKASTNKNHADAVAAVRTLILAGYMITNIFIVSGVIRHWNPPQQCECQSK